MAKVGPELENQSPKPRRWSRRTWLFLSVAVVVILIIIAGVAWYVTNLDLGYGSDGHLPPKASIWHDSLPNGFRCTFGYWTTEDSLPVSWSELMIQLTEGTNYATWNIDAQDLSTGTWVTCDYGAHPLGSLTAFLSVSDIAGNGYADYQDSFEITTDNGSFSLGDIYLVFVLWEPDGGSRVCTDFIIWGDQ